MPKLAAFSRWPFFVGLLFFMHIPQAFNSSDSIPEQILGLYSGTIPLPYKEVSKANWQTTKNSRTCPLCHYDLNPQLVIAFMIKGLIPIKKDDESSQHNHHDHEHEPEHEDNEKNEKEIEEEKAEDKKRAKKKAKKIKKI